MRDMLRHLLTPLLAVLFGLGLVATSVVPAQANIAYSYEVGTITGWYENDTNDYMGKVKTEWIGQCVHVQRRQSATGSWTASGVIGGKTCKSGAILPWSITDQTYVSATYGIRIKIVSMDYPDDPNLGMTKTLCFTKSECLAMRP